MSNYLLFLKFSLLSLTKSPYHKDMFYKIITRNIITDIMRMFSQKVKILRKLKQKHYLKMDVIRPKTIIQNHF